jgi:hypothetical protein
MPEISGKCQVESAKWKVPSGKCQVESAKKQGNNKNLGSSIWVSNVILARVCHGKPLRIPTVRRGATCCATRSEAELIWLEVDKFRQPVQTFERATPQRLLFFVLVRLTPGRRKELPIRPGPRRGFFLLNPAKPSTNSRTRKFKEEPPCHSRTSTLTVSNH